MKSEFQSPADDAPFLTRVQRVLPQLSPAERKLGEFLLDFPGELGSYDAQELARLCDVSKATVSRFIRRLGFSSYDQAKKAVRDERQTGSRAFFAHAEPEANAAALALDMREEKDNLDWTFANLDANDLDRLAAAVVESRKVWIAGQRISQSFAHYLYWQLTKIVSDVVVFPQGGETLGEHVARIAEGDLVIAITLRRRIAGTRQLLDSIVESGARLALISDEGMARHPAAHWHFHCRTHSEGPQFNHAAVLALCHQIVVRATLKAGRAGRERLRRVDDVNEKLMQYE
ncbi:MurR/RpiR family transcriptional regulator [Martelella radicis]|uniref:DNA-binding MurR/RpiR family transcriptional regulator n=1 Tax=Martelella radicis TaxID=1397476 RepID=A0A7W6P8B9_9HYPH|nr:MurR/RpiR family transcriptional regulator [Martelella radicis]MBB4121087.1 DNA-binding MurR/RpiR family transcriptional regulator [Martelella radicis]